MHNLIILGGNPGSGKTTIANLLADRGFTKLSIDDFYQKAPRDPNIEQWFEDKVYIESTHASFRQTVMDRVSNGEKVVIETTGVGNNWKKILVELQATFPEQLVTIYLNTSLEASQKRVQGRNKTDYPFKVTEEEVDKFFRFGKDLPSTYQHVVDADKPLNEVLGEILSLIG